MNKKTRGMIIGTGMCLLVLGSSIVFSEPGSENDPLVSKTYVSGEIDKIKDYIDTKINNLSQGGGALDELRVVELDRGQKLIAKAGTEIILRGGESTAYGVEENKGLSDVTQGVDIDNEEDLLPANHLLIVARNDGRGVHALTNSVFMIKGSYEIE